MYRKDRELDHLDISTPHVTDEGTAVNSEHLQTSGDSLVEVPKTTTDAHITRLYQDIQEMREQFMKNYSILNKRIVEKETWNTELEKEITSLKNQNMNLTKRMAKLETTQGRVSRFVTKLTNEAVVAIEQHHPHLKGAVSGEVAVAAVVVAAGSAASIPPVSDSTGVQVPAVNVGPQPPGPGSVNTGSLPSGPSPLSAGPYTPGPTQDAAQQNSVLPCLDAAPTLDAAPAYNIYLGDVGEKHNAQDISNFISTRSKMDKNLIIVHEFPPRHDGTKAFKVAVPQEKQQLCLSLPWKKIIAQPFRPKINKAASGWRKNTNRNYPGGWNNGNYGGNYRGNTGFRGSTAGYGKQPTQKTGSSGQGYRPQPPNGSHWQPLSSNFHGPPSAGAWGHPGPAGYSRNPGSSGPTGSPSY